MDYIPIQLLDNTDRPLILLEGVKVAYANILARRILTCSNEDIVGKDINEYLLFNNDITRTNPVNKELSEVVVNAKHKIDEDHTSFDSVLVQKFENSTNSGTLLTILQNEQTSEVKKEGGNTEFKEFVYIVSHDLKAPLRAVLALVDWLKTDYRELFDEEGKELVDLIFSRTNRMAGMLEGLVNYSRLINNFETTTQIDMKTLCDKVIEKLENSRQVQFEINEMPVISGQRERIESLVKYLVENSINFMDKEKGVVSIGYDDDAGVFYVADNGPGISIEHKDRVFSIFQTLKPKDELETTGVGLTLAQKIAELHGGQMWLDTDYKEGARFLFTLS